MAAAESSTVVICDAGPIIHLDELDCLSLLSSFDSLLIPQTVWDEVSGHRPHINSNFFNIVKEKPDMKQGLDVIVRAFDLHSGEKAALCLARQYANSLLLTDDAAARLASEVLNIRAHGTIGILIRSIRTGHNSKDEVVTLLESIPHASSLHIRKELLNEIIKKVTKA